MAIGGLWVPTEKKSQLTKELRILLQQHGLGAEVKWSKTSDKCLGAYKAVADFFINNDLHFRVIVIDNSKVNYQIFKEGDPELGFYTFYYEMLIKWLNQPVAYNLLLDFKKNKCLNRYSVLANCLRAKVPFGTKISGVNTIDSHDSPLAQIADLLTGASAASWCGFPAATPKAQLASYIASSLGRKNLASSNSTPEFSKFNVFKIDLQ